MLPHRSLAASTYHAGLLQAKAYRTLKNFLSVYLAAYNLSMPEWALIGHLYASVEGLRLADISSLLAVEAPFATHLVKLLEQKKLVSRQPDPTDSRAKRVTVSALGRDTVPKVESHLRAEMKSWLSDIQPADLLAYIKVLEQIAAKA